MRNLLTASVFACLAFAAVLLAPGRGGAQDVSPAAPAEAAASPESLVEHVMTQLVTAKKGLRVGMKVRDARKALAGSAHMIGTHVLPLDATPYGLPGAKGTVFIYQVPDEDSEVVDELHVSVLCGEFDRKALAARVVAVGGKLGFEMEADEDEEGLYSGSREKPVRSLSVSLAGKGVILLELTGE